MFMGAVCSTIRAVKEGCYTNRSCVKRIKELLDEADARLEELYGNSHTEEEAQDATQENQ